jgi:hypothetical protein
MIKTASWLAAVMTAIAIISSAAPVKAQLAQPPIEGRAAPVMQAGYYSLWPSACPFGSHYVCWRGSYGGRYCGCWPGGDRPACPAGYHFTCRPDPFGVPYCACY